jgi:hypothetical protein
MPEMASVQVDGVAAEVGVDDDDEDDEDTVALNPSAEMAAAMSDALIQKSDTRCKNRRENVTI